jgi:glycerol-3-phosphate acyltransferase PlsY
MSMEMRLVPLLIAMPAAAYLTGSVPFGLLVVRRLGGVDPRQHGSGNIGATNARRLAGNAAGAVTLICDAAKGALPVLAAASLVGRNGGPAELYLGMVALAAFFGHLHPIFLGFSGGGKGVATAAGAFAAISPAAVSLSLLIFTITLRLARRVSIGSLAAAALLPVSIWLLTGSLAVTVASAVATTFIFQRHSDNLRRLLTGKEPKV